MNDSTKKQISEAVETHKRMIVALEKKSEIISAVAEAIIKVLEHNGTIYLCGNGGSAADAQHIAGELVGRFRRERKALAAVALSTDTSILTSIANDYSFEKVFARQVEALVQEGDILWAFSTSGTSPSVTSAARLAKEKNSQVIAFTGRKNSELERISDICFCADNESTARSQEMHQLAYHIICDIVEYNFTEV